MKHLRTPPDLPLNRGCQLLDLEHSLYHFDALKSRTLEESLQVKLVHLEPAADELPGWFRGAI
jgi:hypothetical protein